MFNLAILQLLHMLSATLAEIQALPCTIDKIKKQDWFAEREEGEEDASDPNPANIFSMLIL